MGSFGTCLVGLPASLWTQSFIGPRSLRRITCVNTNFDRLLLLCLALEISGNICQAAAGNTVID